MHLVSGSLKNKGIAMGRLIVVPVPLVDICVVSPGDCLTPTTK